jgi:hypothetical protein
MATATFQWTLEPYESQGYLWLRWSTNAPFRAQMGQIHVYSSNYFPSNPQDDTRGWCWEDQHDHNWNTGLPWGTNWYCGYIAEKPSNGPYVYVVHTITTKAMGPDVEKIVEAI